MLTILKRSGWQIKPLKEAYLSEDERIYLVYLPTDSVSQNKMAAKITASVGGIQSQMVNWPMSIAVTPALV